MFEKPDRSSFTFTYILSYSSSGAQYLDGTTDITRTLHFGEPTPWERQCFTRVLQGHIALATAVFPKGTTGHSLDTLARTGLWRWEGHRPVMAPLMTLRRVVWCWVCARTGRVWATCGVWGMGLWWWCVGYMVRMARLPPNACASMKPWLWPLESPDSVLPSLTVCAEVVWITATGQGTAWGRS